jgi:pyruvate kinase
MVQKYFKKTKIVATIGPVSEKPVILAKMIKAGVNVARLNFSHGDHVEHIQRIKFIKEATKKAGQDIAILQDLGGVKIRIGDFAVGRIMLKKGQKFTLTTRRILGNSERVYINYKKLPNEIEKGQEILLDDGTKKLLVTKVDKVEIETKVLVGGMIRSRRGVNIPGARLSCDALTPKDKKDVNFGIENDVDFMALSFVRSAKDIVQLKNILKRKKSTIKIIAKIETPEAIEDIDNIISVADGIMIARGDLAIEVPASDVPHLQKMIVEKCNIVGKPVIVATQMLESMISTPTPTRAEVTDVANAIFDGADAVMLSAESAVGEYPVETVKMMSEIAVRTEKELVCRIIQDNEEHMTRTVNAVSHSAIQIAQDIDASAIVALTESGFSARKIARYRPARPIIALTPHKHTYRHLQLTFGVISYVISDFGTVEKTITQTKKFVQKNKHAKKNQKIVFVAGLPFGQSGTTNMVVVEKI